MDSICTHVDFNILHSVVEHVFLPPKLPQVHPGDWTEWKTNEALCDILIRAAQDFRQSLAPSHRPLWMKMIKMMKLVHRAATAPLKKVDLQHAFANMAMGGM
jgi:hypothetical protein